MSEDFTGLISAGGNKSTSVTIVISGKTNPKCLECLMLELRKLARECGLTVKSLKVAKKGKKKAKKK